MLLALTCHEVGGLILAGRPATGALFGIVVLGFVGLLARYVSRSVLSFQLSRSTSTNLIATPAGSLTPPKIWLAAHLDSKSQTIPMLLRVASVAIFVVLFVALLAVATILAILNRDGASSGAEASLLRVADFLSVAAAVSLVPVMFCFIGNRSNGALDNASGVAAVLAAAGRLAEAKAGVGVVITSGEELGLAGARAFAASRPPAIAINCDTIDDVGDFICMRSGQPVEGLESALERATAASGIEIRKTWRGRYTRPMLPGILADNVAFTDAGWKSFTVSRGNLRTLARVHTSSDRAETVDGTGIAQAALLIVAIAKELS